MRACSCRCTTSCCFEVPAEEAEASARVSQQTRWSTCTRFTVPLAVDQKTGRSWLRSHLIVRVILRPA